jgi:hypothetical protein
LLVVEDLKRGTNKDMGPKDIFEMASKYKLVIPAKAGIQECASAWMPAQVIKEK